MQPNEISEAIRLAGLPAPDSDIEITGSDPIYIIRHFDSVKVRLWCTRLWGRK